MRKIILFLSLCFIAAPVNAADQGQIESVTIEGGYIRSEHIQSGDPDYRDRHGLGVAKIHTKDYGNWGLYVLSPNSVDKHSIGAGYVTEDYPVELGPVKIEFSGALGLVTGYQDYPVPLLAGEAKWVLYEGNNWDAGISMAALPYFVRERNGEENNFGIVVTSPFLSVKYKFN